MDREPITLTQMLKALDPSDASRVGSKLKKLSKKKSFKPVLDKNKADQIERKLAYDQTQKSVSRWDRIVLERRKADSLQFPVHQPKDNLEKPTDFEVDTKLGNEICNVLKENDAVLHDNQELSKKEKDYLESISVEEARERHLNLQKTRALISCYGAKMRRQKAIKSKSYRRLLKKERIRKHTRKVESDKDLLKNEVEKLQFLRAKERASLKHKNTGKWAKHIKFRTKYDEHARQAMIEQIGLAEKFLKRPCQESSSEDESDESDEETDNSDNESSDNNDKTDIPDKPEVSEVEKDTVNKNLIISNELIMANDDDENAEQRQLMSEAFAGDDVVAQFKKEKAKIADEEQPKDIDNFLPGWGAWTGPGTKTSKKRRAKFIIRAEKVKRRDDRLGNVIISEKVDNTIHQHLVKNPISGTFNSQVQHRKLTKPRVNVKPGTVIEPLSKKHFIKKPRVEFA